MTIRVRIIPEYPTLVISDDGQIQGPSGRWLRPGADGDGYLFVGIKRRGDGRHKSTKVATIVCTAFHGPRPTTRHEVAHGNGIKTDNRAENLRWATRAENHADKLQHGTGNRGERHRMVVLTEAQVRVIKRDLAGGQISIAALARQYGVHPSTISLIKSGKNWGWLSPAPTTEPKDPQT